VPGVTTHGAIERPNAEPSVVETEPVFEQKQLEDGVGEVGELDDKEGDRQVVAVAFAADQAAVAR